MEMVKVSIIIAAFNIEEYIEEALNSAINQTLKDIEIIVVDDASTDKTLEVIKNTAKYDNRVKVIHNQLNKGTLMVRDIAINESSGEYIMFLDGDDSLTPDACEKAYNAIHKENLDIVQFDVNLKSINEDEYKSELKTIKDFFQYYPHKVVVDDKNGLHNRKHVPGEIGITIWNKIYKRDLLLKVSENTPKEYIIMAEDWLFSYLVFFFARSYNYLDEALYNYRVGSGISTTKSLSRQRMESIAKSFYIYTFLEKWFKENADIGVCKEALYKLKLNMVHNISYNFLHNCSGADRQYFFDCIKEYCPIEEIVAMFSYMTYYSNTTKPERTSYVCNKLKDFQPEKKEIKTIGTFYYRMYNGGVENVISNITDIWVKQGYNVIIFTEEESSDMDYYINPAIKRVIIPRIEKTGLTSYENRAKAWKEAIEKHNVDVMVYHAWDYHKLVADLLAIKSAGSMLIMHTHNLFCINTLSTDMTAAYNSAVQSKIYEMADMVITLSDVEQAWWQCNGIRSIKTINPIQMPLSIKPSSLEGNNILLVARISLEKQIIDALKIMAIVKEHVPDAKLTILGGGDDKQYVEKVKEHIKKENLSDVVDMVGYHKDVYPFYKQSAVMLCTSKYEGQSLAMIEGKLCGLPLVTYEISNMDMIRESKGMFVVPQNDINEAAMRIVEILKNDKLKKYMGKEAHQSALDMYSVDLREHWNKIFQLTLQPKNPWKPIYMRSAIESAVAIACEYQAQGIINTSGGYTVSGTELEYFMIQCNALDATIKEIRSSTSFKVGMLITFIPRKIKELFKKFL